MNYQFPVIKTIDDVLPAIADRDEFIVAERDGYTVLNYTVAFADTFPPVRVSGGSARMRAERELHYALRRECRGLIFYPDGKIMSRPFHKFFNVNEREETQLKNVDVSAPHTIMEKMDGSMIRPIIVNDELRLATKMGLTDTALEAEKVLDARSNSDGIREFLYGLIKDGVTPLFEFVSPDNRIVVEYNKAELVLLALRNNLTGEYMRLAGAKGDKLKTLFRAVPTYGSVNGGFEEYINRQRGREGREGDIIRFTDGHMLKIKNDWYVRIHKIKDRIRSDRHVLALVLDGEIDDVMSQLDAADYQRIKNYDTAFHAAYRAKLEYMCEDVMRLVGQAKDKKDLATRVLPESGLDKSDYSYVYKMYEQVNPMGENFVPRDYLNEMMMNTVRSKLGSTAKYNELAVWLGLDADQGEDK